MRPAKVLAQGTALTRTYPVGPREFGDTACLSDNWRRFTNLPMPWRQPLPKSATLAGTTTLCADLRRMGVAHGQQHLIRLRVQARQQAVIRLQEAPATQL